MRFGLPSRPRFDHSISASSSTSSTSSLSAEVGVQPLLDVLLQAVPAAARRRAPRPSRSSRRARRRRARCARRCTAIRRWCASSLLIAGRQACGQMLTPRMRTMVSLRPSIFCMRRKQLPHSQRSVDDDAGEVAQIEADHRLLAAMQDGAHHVADLAVRRPASRPRRRRSRRRCESSMEVQAGLVLALERAHAHLVRAVHVVDRAAPQLLESGCGTRCRCRGRDRSRETWSSDRARRTSVRRAPPWRAAWRIPGARTRHWCPIPARSRSGGATRSPRRCRW